VAVLAAAFGCVGLLSLAGGAAPRPTRQDTPRRDVVPALASGKLLVAARRLPDPNFANTVILLTAMNRDGAVGLIVNRRSEATLARVFPQLTLGLASASHAFFGGPVQRTQAMALVRAPEAPAAARPIVDGLHLVMSVKGVEALITAGTAADRFRVYFGYAGWSRGQLEAEIGEGVWHVLDGDAGTVFAADPATTWQRQIARTEVIQARRRETGDGAAYCGRTTTAAIAWGVRPAISGASRVTSLAQS
jgi:putative transcriptional regulator